MTELWQHTITILLTGSDSGRHREGPGPGPFHPTAPSPERSHRLLPHLLVRQADEVLADHGGRLWDGYRTVDVQPATDPQIHRDGTLPGPGPRISEAECQLVVYRSDVPAIAQTLQ